MSRVRSRDTEFELRLISALSANIYPLGFRYRKHDRKVVGTPDLVFKKYKIAVFLDSAFWHGHNYIRLKSRMSDFWRAKIERNIQRDVQVNRRLVEDGWTVLRFGEQEVKRSPTAVVRAIRKRLLAKRSSASAKARRSLSSAPHP